MPCYMPKKDWRYNCQDVLMIGCGEVKRKENIKDATWWFLFFNFVPTSNVLVGAHKQGREGDTKMN